MKDPGSAIGHGGDGGHDAGRSATPFDDFHRQSCDFDPLFAEVVIFDSGRELVQMSDHLQEGNILGEEELMDGVILRRSVIEGCSVDADHRDVGQFLQEPMR